MGLLLLGLLFWPDIVSEGGGSAQRARVKLTRLFSSAYQITVAVMMMPKGQENMFFGIIGVASGASAWIGPLVVGVIAQKTGNLWLGWPFILAMFVVALAIIYSVDMDVAKPDLASSDSGIMKET